MDEPFGPARRYAFLVPYPATAAFRAADVLTIPSGAGSPTGAGSYVPLFRSTACMARWIGERLAHGGGAGLIAAPTTEVLTDLLTELRKSGATHIAIDPEPGGTPVLISIERAVISFELNG